MNDSASNGRMSNDTHNDEYPDDYPDYNGTSNSSDSLYPDIGYYGDDQSNEHTVFFYEAYRFERPIYLYVWEIFVVITVLVNMLVIWILLRKRMRSVTNVILVAIAIADSMTGLITLPTYIMVYQSKTTAEEDEHVSNMTDYDYSYYDNYEYEQVNYTTYPQGEIEYRDAYMLSKSLCTAFMISKFFLSKSFHTISIWLTIFLGLQRYISVAYPFKVQVWFTTRNTLIVCVAISLSAPILHLYHLIDEKAINGICSWQLKEGCKGGCVHMWLTLFLRHILPCVILTITTILFIRHLNKNTFNSARSSSNRKHSGANEDRGDENRRITKIVIAIVIGLLVPEIPYGIFLLYSSSVRMSNMTHLNDLKRNRAIHAGYELLLVLTFHFNFYIYTFLNPRFRKQLMKTCFCFTSRLNTLRLTTSASFSSGRRTAGALTTKNDSLSNTQDSKGTEMKSLNHSSDDQNNSKAH